MATLGDELNAQIERVVELRTQYDSMRHLPGVNVAPVIYMIDAALKEAREARGGGDIPRMIRAVEGLKGFTA